MAGFDPKTATEAEILERSQLLPGRHVGDLEDLVAGKPGRGKGDVGFRVERFFGIAQNSLPEPDFPAAEIELKVVPLVRRSRGLRVKERTVITMIDYNALVLETWANAHVRKKLKILFVYYEYLRAEEKEAFPIRHVTLWTPDDKTNALLEADWTRVRIKVRHGLAAELSESDGRLLGPCTKGVDSTSVREQPFSDVLAKSRAFALKPSFTLELYRQTTGTAGSTESVATNLGLTRFDTFETDLLSRFLPYIGRTVGHVARQFGVPASAAKSDAARVVRRIFGAKNFRSRILEFAESGLTLRVSRVSSRLEPYESLSFPFLPYSDLLGEEWTDSELFSKIEYMLIVPAIGETRATPQRDCRIGEPVFWRPDVSQVETIRREYEIYRTEIRTGHADDLTPASMTSIIHMRPHGSDSQDTDEAPLVGQVSKKSFWINKGYVGQILRREVPGTTGLPEEH
jgi:DNA mismatch repair endonuclease MutH